MELLEIYKELANKKFHWLLGILQHDYFLHFGAS